MAKKRKPLTTRSDWTFELIDAYYHEIERIGTEQFKLDVFRNQIEIISSEQMLDAYCITPDHQVLRKDLRWIPAGDVRVGDVLLGFDEHGPYRSYKNAFVERVEFQELPVFEVTLDSGKVFKVTENHLWLVRQQKGEASVLLWKSTKQLRGINDPSGHSPSRIPKVMNMWEEDFSKDAGWLAGIYDGEGNIIRSSVRNVCISQNDGIVQDRIKSTLESRGQEFYIASKPGSKSGKCKTIGLRGTVADKLKFLGEVRPERLISKLSFDSLGLMKTPNYENVISVNPIGVRTIVKITTSTGTFVCDGYPMHNSSIGMPIYYGHWSFGKDFVSNQHSYKTGQQGLAYEIVINSDPCISYLMEENTMMMQILVMAHACMGHNAVFKNNYLFKQWTSPDAIVDYLVFAKNYIRECEEKYGEEEVEELLDALHAIQVYGVDKYKRPSKLSPTKEKEKQQQRSIWLEAQVNSLWDTIPNIKKSSEASAEVSRFPVEPEENLLYFIEKNAPRLEPWQREIVRIVRKLAQYFYPQRLTKVLNEGYATFMHYNIVQQLNEEGLLTEGFMLEFYKNHTSVIRQLPFDHEYYSGINPYALGFAIFQDIKRICETPTEEDKVWFSDWAGSNWLEVTNFAMENFKDESFILQFLSPKVMRDMKLFNVVDNSTNPVIEVKAIHNDEGYKEVRRQLAASYGVHAVIPDIQAYNVDVWGDRSLTLRHFMAGNQPLDERSSKEVLNYIEYLWQYPVKIDSVAEDGTIYSPRKPLSDFIIEIL